MTGIDPAFDVQSLATLQADMGDADGSILRDLLASFRQQAGAQVQIVLTGTVMDAIAKAAHGIKGQALTLGMMGLARRASACEIAARDQHTQALVEARCGLGELFEHSIAAFEAALSPP